MRGASLAMRFASLSKPTEAIPTKAWPGTPGCASLTRPRSTGRAIPCAIVAHAARGSLGDAEHAHQIVAAPTGQQAKHRARNLAQDVGDRADRAVAAEHDDGLSRARGVTREHACVIQVARILAAHLQAKLAQRPLDAGGDSARPATPGRRVHQQADGLAMHRPSVLPAAKVRPRPRPGAVRPGGITIRDLRCEPSARPVLRAHERDYLVRPVGDDVRVDDRARGVDRDRQT